MCSKRCYPTRAAARRKAKQIKGQLSREQRPMGFERHIYYCDTCNAYHLSKWQWYLEKDPDVANAV